MAPRKRKPVTGGELTLHIVDGEQGTEIDARIEWTSARPGPGAGEVTVGSRVDLTVNGDTWTLDDDQVRRLIRANAHAPALGLDALVSTLVDLHHGYLVGEAGSELTA